MQGGYSQPYYGYTHLAILTLTIQDGYLETTDELSKQGVASEWPALCAALPPQRVHPACTPLHPLHPLPAACPPMRTLPVHPACAPYLSPPCA